MADLKRRIVAEFSAQNKAKGVMSGFCRDLDVTGRAMRRMATGFLAVAGIGGMGYMLKRTMESIDQIAKMSDELQISTEALTGLEHAAKISGTSIESLHKGMEIFVQRMGEAKYGVGEGVRGLKMLNLTAEEMIAMGTEDAFMKIAERISQAGTAAEQAGIAYNFFGRQGRQMLNMFQQGREGIMEMREEAERLGLTFSRWDAAQVEAANDSLTRARAVFTGIFRQSVIQMAPYIEAIADKFVDVATEGEGMGGKVVNVFETMTLAALEFGEFVSGIPAYWKASQAAAHEMLASLYEIMDAATNLDTLFKKLKMPKWEFTYKELAEQQRKIAAGLFEAGGADLAEAIKKQSAVEKFYDDLRKRAEKWQAMYEERDKKRREVGVGPVPGVSGLTQQEIDEMTRYEEQIIEKGRKSQQALRDRVDEEIRLLGRLDEPRQHAKMMIDFEAAAMDQFGEGTKKAAEAVDSFRGKLEELEEAQKWAEVAESMEKSFEGALERLSQDWRNFGDVAKQVLQEIYIEMMRVMIWRPAAQAAAGWMQAGFSWLMGGLAGGFGFGGAGAPAPGVTPSAYEYYNAPYKAQHGGLFSSPTLATIAETGPELVTPLSQLKNTFGGNLTKIEINNEGSEKLEISKAEEYLLADERVIAITIKAMQTNVSYRRSMKQAVR